jgi:hypothetical protein
MLAAHPGCGVSFRWKVMTSEARLTLDIVTIRWPSAAQIARFPSANYRGMNQSRAVGEARPGERFHELSGGYP